MGRNTTGAFRHGTALRYGVIYAVLAVLWISLSDALLGLLFDDAADARRAGTFKALGFLVVTAVLLLFALRRYTGFHHRSAVDRALLARRLDYLAKYANDSIALIAADGRFIDVNDRFLTTYGYTREETLNLTLTDWHPAYLDVGGPSLLQRLLAPGSRVFETESQAKDGAEIAVEISATVIETGGERLVQAIARDITERRAAEARILALSRLYAGISAANQAITRAASIDEVYAAVCRACVDYGGLRMAWVGLADADGQYMLPQVSFGESTGYLDHLTVRLTDATPQSYGPEAVAWREQRPYVCNDFTEDPATALWHQLAAFHGFRAAISLPLRLNDNCVGTLNAYSAHRDCFDDDAVALLNDLADSISFAMGSFDRRERRLLAETALRLSEARLLEAQVIGNIGDWSYDLEWRTMRWSPQMYRLFERDPASGPPSREEVAQYLDADSYRAMSECSRRAARAGERGEFEYTVRLPCGGQRYHAAFIVPIEDEAGRVTALQGTAQDVTARKQIEIKLRQKEAQLEEAQRLAGMGNWEWLAEVGNTQWSATLFDILGLPAHAPIPESDQLLGMLTPEGRDVVHAAAEQTLRTGKPYEVDLEVACADGTRKWLTCRGEARRSHGQIVGIYGTVQDVTARRRREAERAARELHMHELSHRLIAAQEDERRRLAAELHDRTSPNLAAVQVTLSSLRLGMPAAVLASLGDEFDDLRALLQDTTTSIRDVCADLRPALLDYAGLISALESHIQQFSRRTGVLVKLEHRGIDTRLPAELEALLFRITQEALTNCAKHAQARTIKISLKKGRQRHVLVIADDGVGFDLARMGSDGTKPGLGLLTMRERAEFAAGVLHIESAPGRGTIIRVEI